MCGICGIIGINKLTDEDLKIFQQMLVSCESRGTDAFGYYTEKELFKIKGSVSDYLKKHKTLYKKWSNSKFVLAHTRATTTGDAKVNINNHPFETKNFVLGHNGIISNHDEIKHDTTIETDSYVIIHLIQKEYEIDGNIVEAIKRTTKQISGSYACWLVDKQTGDIYLFRHSNPIEIRYIPDRKAVIFASELNMMVPFIEKETLFGFWKSLSWATIAEDNIYEITTKGELFDWGKFETKQFGYYGVSYTKTNKQRITDEECLSDRLWEDEGLTFEQIKTNLDYYGIQICLRDGRLYLYFASDECYESVQEELQQEGFTISPRTKILTLSDISDLVTVCDLIEHIKDDAEEDERCYNESFGVFNNVR